MIVEVSVSSLAQDRQQAAIYAASGIPYYWIVDLVDRKVEVYSDPASDGYRILSVYAAGDKVPVVIDGVEIAEIAVDYLMP